MKKKRIKKLIREYGFLAEPCISMTESEALRLTDESGVPSFERIAALARAKSALPDEAWAPIERVSARPRRGSFAFPRAAKVWTGAITAALAFMLFLVFTPPGRALAEAAIQTAEKTYHAINRIIDDRRPVHTEDPVSGSLFPLEPTPAATPEPASAAPTAAATPEPTSAPTPEPALTEAPTAAPTPEPTAAPTPAPTPEPTSAPTPKPSHTCGEPGCTDGTSGGYPCCMIGGALHICEANFPDAAFRAHIALLCDADHDGALSRAELDDITDLIVENQGISSLKGVGFFTKLSHLSCGGNPIDSIDLKSLSELRVLHCDNCAITRLDQRMQRKLDLLTCSHNPLKRLILPETDSLTLLDCSDCRLTSLTALSAGLDELDCSNNMIEVLSVKLTSRFDRLDIRFNRIKALTLYPLGGENYDGIQRYYRLSPQSAGSIAFTEGEGYCDFDLASFIGGGLHANITEVWGVMADGSEVRANYHGRKGIARFEEIPLSLRYCFDTGAGMMEISIEVDL